MPEPREEVIRALRRDYALRHPPACIQPAKAVPAPVVPARQDQAVDLMAAPLMLALFGASTVMLGAMARIGWELAGWILG